MATKSRLNAHFMLRLCLGPTLSPVDRVVFLSSQDTIAKIGDGATLAPFNVQTSATLTITVMLKDGTTEDMSTDPRSLLSIRNDGSEHIISLSGNVVELIDTASIGEAPNIVTVDVSFPEVYRNLSASLSLSVVKLSGFDLRLGSAGVSGLVQEGGPGKLRQIACSSVYQRYGVEPTASLSDGTTKSGLSLSSRVSLRVSDISIAFLDGGVNASRVLVPNRAGALNITAAFGGFTATAEVFVEDTLANITSVSIANDFGSAGTFGGLVGSVKDLVVAVTFDDGTAIAVARSGQPSSAWLPPDSLLYFSSDVPEAIQVSADGALELLGNHFRSVSLLTQEICGSETSDTIQVYANLAPEEHDVDLGAMSGAPFGKVNVGDSFDVDIRIQAADTVDLTAFQIVIAFDPDLIEVASDAACRSREGWPIIPWECTTNDPVDEVLLFGSCGSFPSSNCGTLGLREVGTVTFTAIRAGVNHFSGTIIKIKDDDRTTADTAVFAGSDSLVIVEPETERQSLASAPKLRSLSAAGSHLSSSNRDLTGSCNGVLGDANGDCVFDIEDVQYLQYYVGGALAKDALTKQQLFAMDPNRDKDSTERDVAFLSRVLANKYRFLANFTATPFPFSLEAILRTNYPSPVT